MTNYNANIPVVATTFDQWQILFQKNFAQMETAFSANHVSLKDASLSGNHVLIQLVEQAKDSKVQTNTSEFAIFSKEVEDQTDQVFFQYQGNAIPFQFTNYQIYNVQDILDGKTIVQTTFFTFLPGNLICYFGSVLTNKNGDKSSTKIILTPPTCKNVVSVNITYISSSVQIATATSISLTKGDEFIETVNVNYFKSANTFLPFYYFILGNL